MNRREAAARLDEIRSLMARAGEFRHLSGWAAVVNGLLVFAGCGVSKWIVGISFVPWADPVRLAAVWAPVAVLGLLVDVLFTIALARRRGETAWSTSARQMVAGLLPGLVAGAVLTVYLAGAGAYDALPGAWMLCYGVALLGASHFTPWEVRSLGLAFLLGGSVALVALRPFAMWTMGIGFGVLHLLFGAYVLHRYRREPCGAGESAVDDGPGGGWEP
jgi:hypothetical protein